jgi:hypothetical protein
LVMQSLPESSGIEAGSSAWVGSMLKTQEALADLPISLFDFECRVCSRSRHLRLFDALRRLHTPVTTVFYLLTQVLGLRFRHLAISALPAVRRSKSDRVQQAVLLLATLMTAQKRRWVSS